MDEGQEQGSVHCQTLCDQIFIFLPDFHFYFCGKSLCVVLLLKYVNMLEQAQQLLTACVIVCLEFRLCPGSEMNKPIKALWL